MAPTLYNQKPEPGDLIEIFRGPYEHWAVYVGDGYVVHLTAASDVPGSSSKNLSSVPNKNGLVYKEKLQDVVGTNKWRVNNILDNKYRPRPVDDIVKDACALVGKKVTYDVSSSNCEHFATGLRYGKPKSRQVGNHEMSLCLGIGLLGILPTAATKIHTAPQMSFLGKVAGLRDNLRSWE
uniref:LRAT domain-containing protein n=1 Tax=Salarias fasciatus TaxID=181472 RepID=A0A672J3J0_SALFA